MKNTFLITVAAAAIVLCSCKKEKTPFDNAQKNNNGSATAIINGNQFISSVTIGETGSYSGRYGLDLTFDVYQGGVMIQQFVIAGIDLSKPTQRVHIDRYYDTSINRYKQNDSCYSFFGLMNDDESGDLYQVNDSLASNIITISNNANGKIAGTFNLTMYRSTIGIQPAETDLGDTLHITQGKFDVTVK